MTWLPPSVRPSTRPSSLPRRAAGSDGERSRGKFSNPPLHLCGSSSLPLFLCPVALPGRPRSYFCAFCSISAAGSGSGGEGRTCFYFSSRCCRKSFSLSPGIGAGTSWRPGRGRGTPGGCSQPGRGGRGGSEVPAGRGEAVRAQLPALKPRGGHSGIPAPVSLGAP